MEKTKQIKIIFIVASVLLVSLSVFSYFRINSLLKSSAALNHTNLVKLQLESIFSRVKDADAEQRGYVLTKDSLYIHQFDNTLKDIHKRLENLDLMTRDNYSQQKNLEVLNELIEKRIVHMRAVIKDAPSFKITTSRWLDARKIMSDLRTQTDKMMNEEQFLLKLRTKSLIKETALTPFFTIFLICCSIFVLIVSYYGINKELKISNALKSDLEKNNESLEKMNKELESFTYISSHDLQEPLRKIQMFVSRIIDNDSDQLSDTSKNYLDKTNQSANRMQALVRDLLAYSRLKTEIFPLESVNLDSVVNDIRINLEEEIIEENVTIEVTGDKEIKIITSQFRQLLTNLISNSIKFADTKKPLVIAIDNKLVSGNDVENPLALSNVNYSKITVSDNGIGFDPEYKNRIFEVFQRLHNDTHFKGTGIGLAIVKKITENHEGFITADGTPGNGATFTIYLPA